MKQILHLRSILSLLVAGFVAGCSKEAPPPPQMPAPAVTVAVMEPETVTLTRELPGRTNAYVVAEVRPRVTGIVEERFFTEGGEVEQGQELYQLDDAIYRADYNSAKARFARAQATYELAKSNAERTSGLFEANAVSQQELDNVMSALQQAEADLAVAEAAVATSEVLLNYSRITSPISGRIGKSTVTQGALVTANQAEPLATVQQLDPIYVDLTRSSRELLRLRRELEAGTLTETDEVPVTILLEDGTRFEHEGKVAFSEVSVDPTTGSFSLRVVVPNPDHVLLPGMYVRAIVSNGVRENAILVPQQGIARGPTGNTYAMVVNEDGVVEQRPVEVSRAIADKWLVESGLSAGDRVVVQGLQKIRPGSPVQIEKPPLEIPDAKALQQQ